MCIRYSWDTALRENNGHVNPLGLYDLERKIRPVGAAYKELIRQWREVLPTQSIALTLPVFRPSEQDEGAARSLSRQARERNQAYGAAPSDPHSSQEGS